MGRAGSSGQIEAEGKCWLWAARGPRASQRVNPNGSIRFYRGTC